MLNKILVFAKAQLSAFIGGMVDYFVMIFFTEFFHLHYTKSIVIGGIVGAVVNFVLNKQWTFYSTKNRYKDGIWKQFFRFIFVVLNSIALKSSGTYLITHYLKIDYKISRLLVDLVVSLGFNYTLQRYWVFKKLPLTEMDRKQIQDPHDLMI